MKWTPEQQQAVTTVAPYCCVDAGAGSGKTRVLVDRIVYLIEEHHVELDQIVAITFTDKAAGEMKARLRQAFRAKASPDDADIMSRWREMERRVESARISTIHGFCMVLLRENALQQGRDPDFAVLAETDVALLLNQVVTETFVGLLDADDAQAMMLGEEFGAARIIEALKSMVRRHTVIERAAPAYWQGDAEALLQLWNDTVAEETERHLSALQSEPSLPVWIAALRDFEGKCERESDPRELLRAALLNTLTALRAGDSAETILELNQKQASIGLRGSGKKHWGGEGPYEVLKALQEQVRKWLAKQVAQDPCDPGETWQSARLTVALCGVYQRVLAAWNEAKREANAVDFDDLINETRRVLEEDSDLCQRVASGIRYLLMDEFQDTDANQLAIASALRHAPGGPSLFIVGDAKQSIYYFRGAEVEVFAEERKAARAVGEVVALDQNFRTLPDVLEFVNDFFEKSDKLRRVEKPFTRLGAKRPETTESRVEFLVPAWEENEPKCSAEEGRRQEAALIAARIAELCQDQGPALVYDEKAATFRPCHYGDVAILLRGMSHVHLYETALRRAGIPYALVAGAGFYACQEVMDLLSLVRAVLDPFDEQAVAAFLRGPLAGLCDDDLLRMARAGGVAAVFDSDAMPEGLAGAEVLERARALVTGLRAKLDLPPPDFLRHALEQTQFEAVLLGQYLGVQKASNIRKLLEQAEAFAMSRSPSVRAFARYLEEIRLHGIREGEALLQAEGVVSIMTIHRSKGLEFPVVIVGDMSRDRDGSRAEDLLVHRALGLALKCLSDDGDCATPPLGQAIARRVAEEEAAEHARMLYVAITRARDYLILSGSPTARGESWLAMMDVTFDVLSRCDGDCIAGPGWQALVRRVAKDAVVAAHVPSPEVPVPTVLPDRTGPVVLAETPRKTWSISLLLDHMAGGEDPEEESPRDEENEMVTAPVGAAAARARGTLVHRLFERWDFIRDPEPLLPELVAEAGLAPSRREAAMVDLRQIARRFCTTELGMRMASEGEVLREMPFLLNLGNALVSGTIDALLRDGTIVDYKTGARHEEGHARYEWQLMLYAAALKAIRGHAPKMGFLCYVDMGVAYPVELKPPKVEQAIRQARDVIATLSGRS